METDTLLPSADGRIELQVRQIRHEGVGINSYEFVDPAGRALPPFDAGAHIDVHLGGPLVRQYSLCNDPAERRRYVIAVLRDEDGRGGSRTLHERLHVQDMVTVSAPRNHFALAEAPAHVILLAGGIGVTPLKSMAHRLARAGISYELHYCARDLRFAAFRDDLEILADGATRHHYHYDRGNPADGLDIAGLLHEVRPGTHVYYCGPAGFMKACAAATAHWPAAQVHCEHFKAPVADSTAAAGSAAGASDGGFEVQVASTGQVVEVPPDRSIVEALQDIGVVIETSCQSGLCGSCKIGYLSGSVIHNDCILDDAERSHCLTACVSRAEDSELLVLDL